jgi:DNA-nicking Smr family endonuclease
MGVLLPLLPLARARKKDLERELAVHGVGGDEKQRQAVVLNAVILHLEDTIEARSYEARVLASAIYDGKGAHFTLLCATRC